MDGGSDIQVSCLSMDTIFPDDRLKKWILLGKNRFYVFLLQTHTFNYIFTHENNIEI